MEITHASFLRCLRLCGSNSHMLENQPGGVSSSIDVKYDEINPTCGKKTKSERIRHDSRKRRKKTREGFSRRNLVFRGSDGRTYASDCFDYSSHRRVSEMGTVAKIGGEVIVKLDQEVDSVPDLERQNSSFEEERENLDVPVQERMEKDGFLEAEAREKSVEKDAVLGGGEEDREISQMGIASSSFENLGIQSENESVIAQVAGATELPMKTDLQGFMLLMKMLCPVETTIYPGFNGNEVVIGPMDDPSTSQNMKKKPNQEEKRDTSSSSPGGSSNFDSIEEIREEEELPGDEMKSRYKKNKRGRMEVEGLAAFPELSDSDGEPKMDAIPVRVLRRPPSEYRDKLIKVLKRPFDKSEYRELMNEATLKKRKIVYKEMRFGRKRAVETDEKSKSIFDQHPEVKSQVEKARRGRRLTLLRGLFFWLTNCCHDESFMPWQKGYKGSTVQLTINDSELQNNSSTGPNRNSKPKSDRKGKNMVHEGPSQKNNQYKVQDGNESDSASIDTIFCEIEEDRHKQAMEEQDEVLSPTTNQKLPVMTEIHSEMQGGHTGLVPVTPAVCVPSTRSRGKGTREEQCSCTEGEAIGSSSREEEEHTN